MEIPRNLIDVERVIASKNPALLRIIPGFLIRYLKRIVHQDAINGYIYRNRDKTGLDFVDAILQEFDADIRVRTCRSCAAADLAPDNVIGSSFVTAGDKAAVKALLSPLLKPDGRYIIASNHPLGGLDGMALMQVAGAVRPDIVFPVNDILMNVPGLKPLFIPINKHGRNIDNLKIIDQTFESDKVILYFPAGLVSRKQAGGIIRDLEWKKTFISKARRFERDVVPAHISGHNSPFFYNLARWRKRLGIKANLEMLYLVDEMAKQKDQPIRITFGEPIPFQTFHRDQPEAWWAEEVKKQVYALANAGNRADAV